MSKSFSLFASIHRKFNLFLVNKVYVGTKYFKIKRRLLNSIGYSIGDRTKIVGPVELCGGLTIGKDCWIGKNLKINGNGNVTIGDRCDIAPEVTFLTGGHEIGTPERRAGHGESYNIAVGDGVWICARSTLSNNIIIGDSSVVAACSCVLKNVPPNTLVGGVPAKCIKELI